MDANIMDKLEFLKGEMAEHVILTLPLILSEDTISHLHEFSVKQIEDAIEESVNKINLGSKDEMDTLMRKNLGLPKFPCVINTST